LAKRLNGMFGLFVFITFLSNTNRILPVVQELEGGHLSLVIGHNNKYSEDITLFPYIAL
jgi:hypothetical protein